MPELYDIQHPVILFDGMCNLCSNTVQFIIKRDKNNIFRFTSLQSDFGNALLQKFHLPGNTFNSFILYKNGKIYTKSAGALLVAKQLSGAWPTLSVFMIIPSFIRGSLYNIIARNRYKWFGKKEACWLPSPALKSKFLS